MRRTRRDSRRGYGLLAAILVALVVAGPVASAVPVVSVPRPMASPAPPVPGISAVVTWGGTSIAAATSVSSAITTSFTHTVDVNFSWVARAGASGPELYNISTARLQFYYFGAALDTRDVVDSTPRAATNGSFDLQWQPGIFQWLFEGTFGLAAILLAPNGTTMWSQSFYIHAQAPYAIGAVLPVLLLLIGLYEAYGLATSGRAEAARLSPKAKPAAPRSEDGTADEDETEDSPPKGGGSP